MLPATGRAGVEVREETLVLPTYGAGEPERNPMFYFGRASQGAEGRVYPYPLYDTLTHEKADCAYRVVYLENEQVRLGILPEIGGRLFEGVDKSNGYDFIYRQHVIKPALIGLIGAWISGGIEWNIPHHHRATTFIPVQYRVEAHADGSKTVWVGELELRHRTRWAVGYTLHPGSSLIEAKIRVVNRTPVVQTMLCFANVAVHVDEHYQVIFPPRTQHVTHHHKREFTTWPLATGRYGGYDFGEGVEVSWFSNHISANSMFAWNYEDDFLAGYDHGRQAGLLSVADHHIVPGKKLWTWGNGPRGRMWDKILTDSDGPYIELMVGAYSDNQPDYSWLQPFEAKSFSVFWYPFRGIGGVKNATRDAAVNLEVTGGDRVRVGFCTTARHPEATVRLSAGERVLVEETVAIGPEAPYTHEAGLPAGVAADELRAALIVGERELVAYSPVRLTPQPAPAPVRPPPAPVEMATVEELFLTGQWIEQFHNPSLEPDPYWEEALRRDPGDVRVNTALGITYCKRARYLEAEERLRRALERLTVRYAAPRDGEAYYYLGVALRGQGRESEAFDAFYKSTWSAAWQAAGYFALAEIASTQGDLRRALELVERSLCANAVNLRALTLRGALLRRLDRTAEARQSLAAARVVDPLDVRILAEEWLLAPGPATAATLVASVNQHPATGLETAAEYWNAGLWKDGMAVLEQAIAGAPDPARVSPLVYYYLAALAERAGDDLRAAECYRVAATQSPEYVFPFQAEMIPILRRAMGVNPRDARAPYYLGNLLFDWQPAEAVKLWEQSAGLDASFPVVHRNLAIAYSHQAAGNALDRAIASLERAVALPEPYPVHFAELDELYEAFGTAPGRRLALLEDHAVVVARRDDAQSRLVALKVVMGKYDEAIELLTGRQYAVWEGAALSVADYWTDAHLLRGHGRLAAGQARAALADFQAAREVPDNLPSERRGSGSRAAEVSWWMGEAQAALGDLAAARAAWQAAVEAQPAGSRRRSEQGVSDGSVQAYYRARALERLGRGGEARRIYDELVAAARQSLAAGAAIDFFASFGKQQSQRAQMALGHYVCGLGHLGLGEREAARQEFTQAVEVSPDHLGARTQLAQLAEGK